MNERWTTRRTHQREEPIFASLVVTLYILISLSSLLHAKAEELRVDQEAETEEDLIVVGRKTQADVLQDRSTSYVTSTELREQVSRSVPEALGDEVGAYVQQTAHGQGSVYLRGRTGRHTLLMVDGFRLNHALFRQGPNQYLFTIDPLSIHRIDILRGGGAVRLGSNALAGSILVRSKRPKIDLYRKDQRFNLKLTGLYATADLSRGLRAEVESQLTQRWGIYLSAGILQREELEASGALPNLPNTPEVLILEKQVPRFEDDGRIQMGTGYSALSADLVSRYILKGGDWLTALRIYRQYDAPRTDQCPPPEAPETWCLNYDEQFRTHAYSRLKLSTELPGAETLWLGVSFQRQHERRTNDRENYLNLGRDSVNVWELRGNATSSKWSGLAGVVSVSYGLDLTVEYVESKAWDTLVRSEITRERSRGQYLDGSEYRRVGTWSELRWERDQLSARSGARLSYATAVAPEDPSSESAAINRSWSALSLGGGVTWRLSESLRVMINLEEGFAPPNLDDLTARQLTGQGYQIENPDLGAESSLSAELGFALKQGRRLPSSFRLDAELWIFAMKLYDGIERRDATCPMSERSCVAARIATPYTLTNLQEPADVRGIEHQATLYMPLNLSLSEYISYSLGEGPSPLARERDQRRPLSRIPPLNGGIKLRWDSIDDRFYVQLALRWASAQDRLSFGDEIDHRVPYGGTPGYRVYHAQVGLRDQGWELNLNLENLTDQVYRVHGSSVNGAARGISLFLSRSI